MLDGRKDYKRWAISIALLTGVITGPSCGSGNRPRYDPAVFSDLMAQYPVVVSVSPDGKKLLVKTRSATGFTIAVLDGKTLQTVAESFSPDTQLSLTWKPDSSSIVYLSDVGANRRYRMYLWNLSNGTTARIEAPETGTALPPIRWTRDGRRLAYFEGNMLSGRLILLPFGAARTFSVAIENLKVDSNFDWSPDGSLIAGIQGTNPGVVMVVETRTLQRRQISIDLSGEVRDLAWSPSGARLLITVRKAGLEYFELDELDLHSGGVRQCAQPNGDVLAPQYLSNESFLYHVNENGAIRLYAGNCSSREVRSVGPASGKTQLISNAPTSDVFALHFGTTLPPALYSFDSQGRIMNLVYSPPRAGIVRIPAAELVRIRSRDGALIPLCIWRPDASTGPPQGAVLTVHGGPHLEQFRIWSDIAAILTKRGFELIAVNYRGSSGFGAAFESAYSESNAVEDIDAACKYAIGTLGAASRKKVVLLGSSLGSYLAVQAVKADPDCVSGLVLLSISRRHSGAVVSQPAPPFPVAAFHGENDPVRTPEEARDAIEGFLGKQALDSPSGSWRVFVGEGHYFQRTTSWAEVYTKILEFLNGSGEPTIKY